MALVEGLVAFWPPFLPMFVSGGVVANTETVNYGFPVRRPACCCALITVSMYSVAWLRMVVSLFTVGGIFAQFGVSVPFLCCQCEILACSMFTLGAYSVRVSGEPSPCDLFTQR